MRYSQVLEDSEKLLSLLTLMPRQERQGRLREMVTQGMQNGLVSFSWWYPLGHASHDVLLSAAWKRPAAQGAQSVARAYLDSFWNLPGEHVTHAEEAPSRRR